MSQHCPTCRCHPRPFDPPPFRNAVPGDTSAHFTTRPRTIRLCDPLTRPRLQQWRTACESKRIVYGDEIFWRVVGVQQELPNRIIVGLVEATMKNVREACEDQRRAPCVQHADWCVCEREKA